MVIKKDAVFEQRFPVVTGHNHQRVFEHVTCSQSIDEPIYRRVRLSDCGVVPRDEASHAVLVVPLACHIPDELLETIVLRVSLQKRLQVTLGVVVSVEQILDKRWIGVVGSVRVDKVDQTIKGPVVNRRQ